MRISQKISIFALVIELARHLEVLLLSNDCVAVPDFGGFVAHYIHAHVDEADRMFLPPMRTIGFNPQLKMNDSLLAQSYMEAYDISYPEALRRIEQEIDQIRRQISYEGTCQLDSIGTLSSNDEGIICFEPYESGVLTPSLYGLGSYEFPLLKAVTSTPVNTIEEVVAETDNNQENVVDQPLIELIDNDEDEEHAIHIKMSWVRNAVAIAAAIVLFFMMTTPVANSDMGSPTMSALQSKFIQKLIPVDSNKPVAIPQHVVKIAPVINEKPKKVENADSTRKVIPITEKPYCLVLASQVRKDNAEVFAKQMRDRGFKDTEVHIHNHIVRVVYGHFKSESAAYTELHNLRFEEDFEEAWVYKRKTEG